MLYWTLQKQALPWLMLPLMLESFILITAVSFLVVSTIRSKSKATLLVSERQEGAVLKWIGAMGSTAPMLGLLGTVVGLSLAFGQTGGFGNSEEIGKALSTQLYTTAYGIGIALPAQLFLSLWPRLYGQQLEWEQA